MILFTATKKDLDVQLKRLKRVLKIRKDDVFIESDFTISPKLISIQQHGIEVCIDSDNLSWAEFKVYFVEFHQAIENTQAKSRDKINFILNDNYLQVNDFKVTLISSNLKRPSKKKYQEKPLGILNYEELKDGSYKNSLKDIFYLRKNTETSFHKQMILDDIKKAFLLLEKYNFKSAEIKKLVFDKLIEKQD